MIKEYTTTKFFAGGRGVLNNSITCENIRACHQLKDFVAKMAGFENRTAEYLRRI